MRIAEPSSASRCPDMLVHSKIFPLVVDMGVRVWFCLVTSVRFWQSLRAEDLARKFYGKMMV